MVPPHARFQFPVSHTAKDVVEGTYESIRSVVAKGQTPVVVFDLDGTLFDNGPRTWQILYEFSTSTGRHVLTNRLRDLPKLLLPYTLADILRLVEEPSPDLLQEAAGFWKDRFFQDDYIRYDEPLAGAIQFANKCWELGATLVYFSGRDAPNMLVGTTQSLRTHRFPVGLQRTVITLKEAFEKEDLVFKSETLDYLDRLGTVVAAFDNEPANCNMFLKRWPHAHNVAVATAHAPNPRPLDPGVKVIEDFAA